MSPPTRGLIKQVPKTPALPSDSTSNSSWAEMESYVIGSVLLLKIKKLTKSIYFTKHICFIIGNIQIHPPTDATRQMLILRYLTPMGEYQEVISFF